MNGKLRCAIDNALQTRNMKEYVCRHFMQTDYYRRILTRALLFNDSRMKSWIHFMHVITTLVPLEAFCGIMDDIMMNIQYDYETGGLLDEKHIRHQSNDAEYYCEILSSLNNIDELELACIQMRTSFHDDEWDLIGEMEFYVFTWLHEHGYMNAFKWWGMKCFNDDSIHNDAMLYIIKAGEMSVMIDAACGAYMNHADNDIANTIIDVIMRGLDSSPVDYNLIYSLNNHADELIEILNGNDYDYHYDERMIMRIHDGMSAYDISEFIHDSDNVNEIITFIHAVRLIMRNDDKLNAAAFNDYMLDIMNGYPPEYAMEAYKATNAVK